MGQILAPETSAELLGWSPRRSSHALADGRPLTLYVQFSPEGAAVSDLGGTLPLIHLLPPLARIAVRATCRTNDVQIDRGTLVTQVPPGGDLSEAVDRLGRVCAQLSRTASEAGCPSR